MILINVETKCFIHKGKLNVNTHMCEMNTAYRVLIMMAVFQIDSNTEVVSTDGCVSVSTQADHCCSLFCFFWRRKTEQSLELRSSRHQRLQPDRPHNQTCSSYT